MAMFPMPWRREGGIRAGGLTVTTISESDPVRTRSGLISGLGIPVLAFALSRLALLLIGLLARDLAFVPEDYVWIYDGRSWLDIWGVWDTGWFLSVMTNGYMSAVSTSPETLSQANWAFFPLYPMMAFAVAELAGLSGFVALLVVSNLCFLAALVWVRAETQALYGSAAANWAVVLLCAVPGSHVFSSAYSEATFLLFIVGTLAMARQGRWLIAGGLAALSVLTKNFGVLLLAPMAVYYAQRNFSGPLTLQSLISGFPGSGGRGEFARFAVSLMLPCLALGGFMLFLHFRAGDFLAFATIQSAWGRSMNLPIVALFTPLGPWLGFAGFSAYLWPSVIAGWVALGLCIALLFKRQWAHASFCIPGMFVLLSAGILSVFRLVLPLAPLAMVAASLMVARPKISWVLLALIVLAEALLMWGWALGWPIF
ncbi:mannosyltransferase family protein [Hoeflea sp.]|uniref:mannosyltransferase family protein n=1 Tax=Hoeflea sp. TaxID=1940281 RepID=UPI003BAF95E0